MKLFFAPASPYARKCRIVVFEKKLEKKVQLIEVNPAEDPRELLDVNPIGKVPALWVDKNLSLCESPVICEYLDSIGDSEKLFPTDPALRFHCLELAALASGIMDAAVISIYETRRPRELQSAAFLQRKDALIRRTLESIASGQSISKGFTIGEIALVSALGYLSLRLPDIDWGGEYSELSKWYDVMSKRSSCAATAPR